MSLPVLAFSGKFRTKIPQQDAGPSSHLVESSSHSVVRNMLGPSVPPHRGADTGHPAELSRSLIM